MPLYLQLAVFSNVLREQKNPACFQKSPICIHYTLERAQRNFKIYTDKSHTYFHKSDVYTDREQKSSTCFQKRAVFKVYRVLFKVCRALFKVYRVLFKVCRALFKVYRVLFKVCRALFNVCKALSYKALVKVYRALLKI